MQGGFFSLSLENSYKSIETIKGIKLTHREIDVIACITSGRASTKTIASLLSVDPKTVEAHIHNIRLKLGHHSRESIVSFVEKEGKFAIARQHYLLLLIHSVFEQKLQQASLLVAQKNISCLVVYEKQYESFIDYLKKYLKYLGIEGIFRITEMGKSLNEFYQDLNPHSITHCVFAVSLFQFKQILTKIKLEDSLLLEALKSPKAITFVSFEEKDETSISQEAGHLYSIAHIRFGNYESYYFSFFDFLKRLFPEVNLDKPISEFKEQYDTLLHDFSGDPILQERSLEKTERASRQLFIGFLKKQVGKLFITSVFCMGVVYMLILGFRESNFNKMAWFNNSLMRKTIRSDLILSHDAALLKRPKLLHHIEEKLKGHQGIQTVALVGIGGAGKTILARQYARQKKASVVWEINAETKISLKNSFENLSYALCQTEKERKFLRSFEEDKNQKEREEKILLFVKQKLKVQEVWLLIFDNVDKFSDIQKYFPSDPTVWGKGKVILTTRDIHIKNNGHITHTVFIEELTPEEKLDLFTKLISHTASSHLYSDQKEQKEFLRHIPPFPLDVSIAARYLEAAGVSYEKYLKYMNENHEDFEKIQQDILAEIGIYTKTRYRIMAISFKKLMEEHEDFGALLLLISLLDSQNIPRDLLNAYKNDLVVDHFIYHLKKYSLITGGSSPSVELTPTFSIHRSTQKLSLAYLTKVLALKKEHPLIQSVATILEDYMVNVAEKGDIPKMRIILPHTEMFLNHSHLLTEMMKDSVRSELGFLYFFLNRNPNTMKLLEEVLENFNKFENKDYKKIARLLLCLGRVHRHLGDYEKAQNVLEQSLAIAKKHLLERPIDIARILTQLGYVCRCSGSYQKAKKFLEEGHLIYETCSPKSYIGLSRASRYLGTVYRELGQYEKAQALLEQSLAISKKYLLGNPVETNTALAQLGNVMRDFGYYEKGKNLLEKSLKICRSYYPKDHLEVAWVLKYLGASYKDLGQYEKAKSSLKESLSIYRKLLPETHVGIGEVKAFLGDTYRNLGNYEKARNLLKESLAIYEKYYGKDHILNIQVLKYLAEVYLSEGHLDIAENLLQKALKISRKNNHVNAYTCLESLSDLYFKKSLKEKNSKKYQEQAIIFLKETLSIIRENFPKECPHLLRVQSKLRRL